MGLGVMHPQSIYVIYFCVSLAARRDLIVSISRLEGGIIGDRSNVDHGESLSMAHWGQSSGVPF